MDNKLVPTYIKEKSVLERLIEEHPDKIKAIKSDHRKIGWLVGQILKAVNGLSNRNAIYKIVVDRLDL